MQDKTNMSRFCDYKIMKANDLIQRSYSNLSAQEQKVVLYLIAKMLAYGAKTEYYMFSIFDYCKVFGISQSGQIYANIKLAIKKLANNCFLLKLNDNKTMILLKWIESLCINKETGAIKIKLDNRIKPYLLQLQDNFTVYNLCYVVAMKSKYSLRLYEHFKSYENSGKWEVEIEELKRILCAKNYSRFPDFKRNVIDVAVLETNKFGDICVTYKITKKGKKYSTIIFSINSK